MKTKIDLDTWPRREHFQFFNQFDEPYHSIVATVDLTRAYIKAKELGISLYLYYMHCTLTAVNSLENFKYRAEEGEVFLYDTINVSATVARPDGLFGFGSIDYNADLATFAKDAKKEITRVSASGSLFNGPNEGNLIHFSALPWINFTGLTHARNFAWKDSVPKVSVGKITEQGGKRTMPVSITVHHGLADGLHAGQFIELFQQLLDME